MVHVNSASNLVENITFMHCPPDRNITVPVPVQVMLLLAITCAWYAHVDCCQMLAQEVQSTTSFISAPFKSLH